MRSLFKLLPAVLIIMCSQAKGQDFFPQQTDYAFHIGADYDLPGNILKDDYKPGMNFSLSFLKYYERYTFNFTAAYRTYNARFPEISEVDETTGIVGQWTASPYSTVALYAGGAYNINLTETVRAYGGLNVGIYFSSASFSYRDGTNSTYLNSTQKQAYVAPKLGIIFGFSNYLDLDLRTAYNVFTQGVKSNSRTGSEGSIYTSISAGLGLAFKF